MTRLQWNSVTDRFFEAGLNNGVLYSPDGSVVPWNGLISINEKASAQHGSPVYFDGRVIYQDQTPGNYAASLKAFTYPDEFHTFSGFEEAHAGVFLGDQPSTKTFGLSWRTDIGNGSDSKVGYKIHILYNVSAVPSAVNRETLTENSNPALFEWDIRTVPDTVSGFRPTAYVVIDSRKIDRYRLESVERYLYGGIGRDPQLGTVGDLMSYVENDVLIRIIDNGDGTWTAEGPDDLVTAYGPDWFQIESPDATYLNSETFTISTTEY